MGHRVRERAVKHPFAVDGEHSGPVVPAVIRIVARPERVGFEDPRPADGAGQQKLLDPAGFGLVHGLVADRDEFAGPLFGLLHDPRLFDGRRHGFLDVDVCAGFERRDGHRAVHGDSGRNEADVDFAAEFLEHGAVVGEEPAADRLEKGALLGLFGLVDDGGGDDVDSPRRMFPDEIIVMHGSESGDPDNSDIDHGEKPLLLKNCESRRNKIVFVPRTFKSSAASRAGSAGRTPPPAAHSCGRLTCPLRP